jgi:translation elongation factor EF-Ts
MAPRIQQDTSAITLALLERDLAIDRNALDEALLTQPDLFYRASKKLAELISQRDAAKQDISEAEAEADKDIRSEIEEAGTKITEKEVESRKRIHPEVSASIKTYLNLNLSVGQFTALVDAFKQRSYVLKSLSDLHISGYFGDAINSNQRAEIVKDKMAEKRRAR